MLYHENPQFCLFAYTVDTVITEGCPTKQQLRVMQMYTLETFQITLLLVRQNTEYYKYF